MTKKRSSKQDYVVIRIPASGKTHRIANVPENQEMIAAILNTGGQLESGNAGELANVLPVLVEFPEYEPYERLISMYAADEEDQPENVQEWLAVAESTAGYENFTIKDAEQLLAYRTEKARWAELNIKPVGEEEE